MRKRCTQVTTFLFLLWVVPFCLSASPRRVIVGGDRDYAPFTFLQDGKAAGFDVDFFKLLSEKLSLAPVFHFDTWADILKDAREGHVDVVLSLLYSPERDKYLSFTIPYDTIQMSLVVRKGMVFDSVEDLKGKKMALLEGDALPKILLTKLDVSVLVTPYKTLSLALTSVNDHRNDFCIVPSYYIERMMKHTSLKNLKVMNPKVFITNYRIGITRGNEDLLSPLNRAIREVKNEEAFEELQEKWFPLTAEDRNYLFWADEWGVFVLVGVILLLLVALITVRFLLRRIL